MVYVTPGRDMLIRPGQHVGVDGRVYHPYLRDWSSMWDRASIVEFLSYLQQVFSKEPPVISKAQQQQYYQRPTPQSPGQKATGASPAPPQLPPKQRPGSVQPVEMPSTSTPPPRPPKPGEDPSNAYPQRTASRNVSREGPPLPPLPAQRHPSQYHVPSPQHQNGYAHPTRPPSQMPPSQTPTYQHSKPPVPPIPQAQHQQYQQVRANHDRSPVSPISPSSAYTQDGRYSQAPPLPFNQQLHLQHQQPAPPAMPSYRQDQPPYQPHYQQPMAAASHPPYTQPTPYPIQSGPHQMQAQPARPAPPPDLLSDPFDVALPGPGASGPQAPAPPIPPNPEKEHLLQALSTSLTQQAQHKIKQNLSALAPLQAQQAALQTAYQRLEAEIRQLQHLSTTLDANEAILRQNMQDCDKTIAGARTMQQPPIDEVLVAPTLVANQLWVLCAEEAACREAMYVLQKAVDRGRVSGADFVRQMRGLGRECFLKMVLARKCARGLGLEVGGEVGGLEM